MYNENDNAGGFLPSHRDDDFNDVIQLTEFDGAIKPAKLYAISEYQNIDHTQVEARHKQLATTFVNKISKFVLDFNDDSLTEDHREYLKTVADLEIGNLTHMLYIVDINKQMIANVVDRINTTMCDDYAILTNYNQLVTQHVKLVKELSNTYKNIPSVLKRMKTDVITDQVLDRGSSIDKELITAESGETQFNSSKQLLRAILADRINGGSNIAKS